MSQKGSETGQRQGNQKRGDMSSHRSVGRIKLVVVIPPCSQECVYDTSKMGLVWKKYDQNAFTKTSVKHAVLSVMTC